MIRKTIKAAKNKNSNGKSIETGVMLEHLDDKITLVAEQYIGLNDKYEKLDQKYDKLDQKFDKKFDKLDQKFDVLTEVTGEIKKDVEVLKDDVGIIKMDIEFIKHELKNKINRDEFIVLERRVAILESRR